MFVEKTLERNRELVGLGLELMKKGEIEPDTYIIDTDAFLENARKILAEGRKNNIDLYFMLKQAGRNPWIARKLVDMGYKGAVVVDYREARLMMEHHIPICNVGHLVQCPKAFLKEIIEYGPAYITVFSLEKAQEISDEAMRQGKTIELLLRVVDEGDQIYSGQTAGFEFCDLPAVVDKIKQMPGVKVGGVTSFPTFLFNEETGEIEETHNLYTLLKARKLLAGMGIENINVNAPSATCVCSLKRMSQYSEITSAEPGHGLSGTTPLHSATDQEEIPSVVYVTEISHNFRGHSYCYGGGYYRRSHVKYALVGKSLDTVQKCTVLPMDPSCIDYYFELDRELSVSDPVCMAFRYQIFVTRSHVVLVEGLSQNDPHILGTYDAQGRMI